MEHQPLLHKTPSLAVIAAKRQRVRSGTALAELDTVSADELGPTFCEPLLPAVFGESMAAYFRRLGESTTAATSGQKLEPVAAIAEDGIYLHKRPVRGVDGSSPLAVCGTVLHHVLVYVKQGSQLHCLDYGPANGQDVTANLFAEAPSRQALSTATLGSDGKIIGDAAAGGAADGGDLPYLFLGPATWGVDHPLVAEFIAFAEAQKYHAILRNCIHFADVAVRLLTAGAVRAAPQLYDNVCGAVPPVDNPALMFMQLMFKMPWTVAVDGTPLAAAFKAHLSSSLHPAAESPAELPACAAGLGRSASEAAEAEEECENNVAAVGPGEAGPAPAAAAPVPAAAARRPLDGVARDGTGASGEGVPEDRGEKGQGQGPEEGGEELENDHAAGTALTEAAAA
ncbi:hypothetical protein HYH03_008540 [Edaphochlamys debaryana]|uniref:Uncharacterized protein n=1 Tax=Edaphochlamys debaryana TaxID=47281 RepID=A0A835Y6L1_9CHLO|nr:hypothetical protein HYH03_008540 [Edaphochlamys debaryana]|eukprot:KAG2493415.1 hypothetical protein HYH03_008540 [Edaphochlamys debaryana]